MPVVVITPPSVAPVSLSEVKEWCGIAQSDTSKDRNLRTLIDSATARAEKITGRVFVRREMELKFDSFELCDRNYGSYHDTHWDFLSYGATYGRIDIPFPPLIEISSITYFDQNGDEQELDPSLYEVDTVSEPGNVRPIYRGHWPAHQRRNNGVTISFAAGYLPSIDSPVDSTSSVPPELKEWMQTKIVSRYDQKSGIVFGRFGELSRDYVDGILDGLIVGTRFA